MKNPIAKDLRSPEGKYRKRIEKNKKGKGAYRRARIKKEKIMKQT